MFEETREGKGGERRRSGWVLKETGLGFVFRHTRMQKRKRDIDRSVSLSSIARGEERLKEKGKAALPSLADRRSATFALRSGSNDRDFGFW